MPTMVMTSPLTGLATTYYEHSCLMTFRQGNPVAPDSLKTLMNSEITKQGYDAIVDDVKIIQEPLFTDVQAHMWIAGQSPVIPWLAIAILIICVTILGTVWIIASTAQTIIEHFWPTSKFYQKDASGNDIVVGSLSEYITCQQAANPGKFVCGYCGQVFDTVEDRDTHQANCPWKEGVPGAPPSWAGIVIIGLGAVVVLAGIWVVAKVFGKPREREIIVAR